MSDTALYSEVSVQDDILIHLVSLPSVYDQITASGVVSTQTEIYSPQIPQYRPRGYKEVMDNFQYGGGVRIGGY